jgi:ADP-ribosylglycohydrolase
MKKELETNTKEAVSIDPNNAEAYNDMGNAYDDLKRYEQAIGCYKKAVRIIIERDIPNDAASEYRNLGESYERMFPDGEQDIEAGTEEVLRILNNKIDRKTAKSIFIRSTAICHFASRRRPPHSCHTIRFPDEYDENGCRRLRIIRGDGTTSLGSQLSIERLKMHLSGYALKYFDEDALSHFYAYLIDTCNMPNCEWRDGRFDQSQACSADEIPNATGEFGLCSSNPVPVYGVGSNNIYLNRLKTLDGKEIVWKRIGSTGDKSIKNPIDKYAISNALGELITHIFISPYHLRTSLKAPKGFITSLNLQTTNFHKAMDRLNRTMDYESAVGSALFGLAVGDSSLAFCLAEALTHGFDLNEIGQNFVKWFQKDFWTPRGEVFDVGSGTQQAIIRLAGGTQPELAGGADETSNGNGSLMRILPLLFYVFNKPIEERFRITRQVSSITHGHIRSVIACFYYLEFAREILCQTSKQDIYEILQSVIPAFLATLPIDPQEIAAFHRLLKGDISALPEDEIKSAGYVVDTLEASIWCLLTTDSYEGAVLHAVNLGGDTDTTASVTGGLAGLYYGLESIPKDWLQQIARRNDIEDLAKRLSAKITSNAPQTTKE